MGRMSGRRGEYLVAMQFLLVALFVVVPSGSVVVPDVLAGWWLVRSIVLAVFLVVAAIFGLAGLWQIRHSLTPLPYPVDHNRLETGGIYSLVRHPLYSSQLFATFGWTLYTAGLWSGLITVLLFLLFDYKAAREEQWLIERHAEYAGYARQVRKFIPWLY